MSDPVRIAANQVRAAVLDKGKNPEYHDAIMARIRQEAPVLYKSIAILIGVLEKTDEFATRHRETQNTP